MHARLEDYCWCRRIQFWQMLRGRRDAPLARSPHDARRAVSTKFEPLQPWLARVPRRQLGCVRRRATRDASKRFCHERNLSGCPPPLAQRRFPSQHPTTISRHSTCSRTTGRTCRRRRRIFRWLYSSPTLTARTACCGCGGRVLQCGSAVYFLLVPCVPACMCPVLLAR